MNKKKLLNLVADGDTATILLYGVIGDWEDVKTAAITRELMEAESTYKRINVRINSVGGEVYAGIAIFNALRSSKADIRIYVDGIAASMASVIALCGKPVEMSKYARLMLHAVSGGSYGTKADMQKVIEEMESLETTLCDMYAEKTGMSAEEIKSAYFDGTDHYLTANEAFELGFIDGIYDSEPVPEESTPEQIYQILNNRLDTQNKPNVDVLNRICTALKLDSNTPIEGVLVRIGAMQIKDESPEAQINRGLEMKFIRPYEKESLMRMSKSDSAGFSNYMKERKDEHLTNIRQLAENMVNAAQEEGRLNRVTGVKEFWMKAFEYDFEGAKTAIEALRKKKFIRDVIASKGDESNRIGWTLSDYRKKAPKELSGNPGLYQRLLNEEKECK
jgi:ATP-dependent Clp endopeptidase proteolytic subunit ClpP